MADLPSSLVLMAATFGATTLLSDATRGPSLLFTIETTVTSCERVVPLVVNVLLAQRMLTMLFVVARTIRSSAFDGTDSARSTCSCGVVISHPLAPC